MNPIAEAERRRLESEIVEGSARVEITVKQSDKEGNIKAVQQVLTKPVFDRMQPSDVWMLIAASFERLHKETAP